MGFEKGHGNYTYGEKYARFSSVFLYKNKVVFNSTFHTFFFFLIFKGKRQRSKGLKEIFDLLVHSTVAPTARAGPAKASHLI